MRCLTRKTICCSRSVELHKKILGVFIEKYRFYLLASSSCFEQEYRGQLQCHSLSIPYIYPAVRVINLWGCIPLSPQCILNDFAYSFC
ncbi:IS1 family transposase [Enterobacteriaceae bacterium LUAb1]